MPLILGTNSIKDTGYNVSNSVRMSGATVNLQKDFSGDGNRRTWTYSTWFKLSNITQSGFFNWGKGNPEFSLRFESATSNTANNYFRVSQYDGSQDLDLVTSQFFADPSAWGHMVVACDTTQGTASNRIKVYFNGTQITSFSTESYPSQNFDTFVNQASKKHYIGYADYQPINGYLCETVFIDGTQLDATSFGEFDSDSPNIWKPKDVSGLTFGTNGYYLQYKEAGTSQNASGIGADTSGNNNHFACDDVVATDQSTDTCTNNFATINSLNTHTSINLSEGNLKATGASSSSWVAGAGTIGITKGFPCYWEAKATTSTRLYFGLSRLEEADPVTSTPSAFEGTSVTDYMWRATTANTIFYRGSNLGATISAVSTGDIMACSVDSSGIVKFYNNGSVIYTFSQALIDGFFYFPIFALNNYSSTETIEANFGNPAFSISSGNTDANGYGNFEHAPPANHYALNTKNLSEFG
jgi:hypothetical protein